MRTVTPILLIAAALSSIAQPSAATVYDLSTSGTIGTNSTHSCNYPTAPTCAPCVGSSATLGPVIAFGQTGFNGLSAWGTVQGTFSAHAVLNGVAVSGLLLPQGSYFRSGLTLRHSFCLGFSGNDPCPGYACGVTYQIGSVSGSVIRTGTTLTIDLPAEEAVNGTFRFDFCNHHITWGAGCNVAESVANRWLVVTPAPVVAAVLPAGDAPAHNFAGTGVTVDKAMGPGGTLTATRITGTPASPPPATAQEYPDYWELRTDLAAGSFLAQLRIAYDPARLPGGTLEERLTIWRMDHASQDWEPLPTTIDVATHTAIAPTLDRFSIFCLGTLNTVPARQQSWGGVKSGYR